MKLKVFNKTGSLYSIHIQIYLIHINIFKFKLNLITDIFEPNLPKKGIPGLKQKIVLLRASFVITDYIKLSGTEPIDATAF